MQAASRESLLAARERLDEIADELDEQALTELSDELAAVARLLVTEFVLRRALSDPATDPEARTGLADGVFADRVAERTRQVVAGLVHGRWSTSRDLLDAFELLTVQTIVMSAEKAGCIADVEDELFRFARIVGSSADLAASLGDAIVPPAQRNRLAQDLLADKAHPQTLRLVELAVGGFGGRIDVEAALDRLVDLVADYRQRSVAVVGVASALTDEQQQRLSSALGRIYGREMDMHIEVDEQLLGGVRVQVGHDLYDGSVARRLVQARAALRS